MQPLLQWKSNEYYTTWVCVCSLRYPACNVHAPYYHLWPAPLYNIFPHFRKKKVTEHKMGVLTFCTTFVWNNTYFKKKWARYDKTCIGRNVKYPLFVSYFDETSIFLDRFSKNSQISNFMKIRPVGAELCYADWRTERQTKLILAFRNVANAPKYLIKVISNLVLVNVHSFKMERFVFEQQS